MSEIEAAPDKLSDDIRAEAPATEANAGEPIRSANGRFQKGSPPPKGVGRKKGSVNRFTRTIKDTFEEVFKDLQKTSKLNLLAWAKENPSDFYKLANRLIEKSIDLKAEVRHIDAITPQGLLEGARRIAFVLAKAARLAGEAPAPMKLLPHEVSEPKEVEVAVEVLPVAPDSEPGYRHKPFSDEELSDLAEQRRIERQAKVVSQTSYLGNSGPFRRR